MPKFNDDFYQACVAMRNQPGPQRFIASLEEYLESVRDENDELEEVPMYRSQGVSKFLKTLLAAFYAADEMKRRIDKSNDSGGKSPSKSAIT